MNSQSFPFRELLLWHRQCCWDGWASLWNIHSSKWMEIERLCIKFNVSDVNTKVPFFLNFRSNANIWRKWLMDVFSLSVSFVIYRILFIKLENKQELYVFNWPLKFGFCNLFWIDNVKTRILDEVNVVCNVVVFVTIFFIKKSILLWMKHLIQFICHYFMLKLGKVSAFHSVLNVGYCLLWILSARVKFGINLMDKRNLPYYRKYF